LKIFNSYFTVSSAALNRQSRNVKVDATKLKARVQPTCAVQKFKEKKGGP